MIKILLVEDQVLMRMGLRMALSYEGTDCQIVAEAGSVKEAIEKLEQNLSVDVVLLDVLLPDGLGIDVMQYIRNSGKDVKVLVVSSDTTQEHIMQLIEMGVDGFISKGSEVPVLMDAIRSVMLGHEYFGQDIQSIIQNVMSSKMLDEKIFTNRELEIVQLCVKGYSVKMIAEELNVSTRTVESHKNNIFKKLGFNSTGEMVSYVLKNGIVKY